MTGLDDIQVVRVDQGETGGLMPAVQALVAELVESLHKLHASGETAVIDLRGMPLSQEVKDQLRTWLGTGEVEVRLESLGPTRIHETAYPGIWWITHRNRDEEIMTELIEVTFCPEIIRSQNDDINEGLERLRDALAEASATGESV